MRTSIIIIFFLFLAKTGYSQEQNANWYFGTNAGLNFSTNPSSVVNNGQITSLKKTASISDNSGNLLFYTDGKTVWNKNHTVMQNGNETLNSSTIHNYESVVLLPIPDTNKYYIFTEEVYTNYESDGFFTSTYFFSIVNMDANNGLGIVESLNNVLLASIHEVNGEDNYYNYHHNITTALHANEESYWLILKPNDYFYSFHITSNQLVENPDFITSSTRYTVNQEAKSSCSENYSTEVSLKSSPNSDKLASINDWGSCLSGSSITVYDFDNSTGIISNDNSSTSDIPEYISLEFSPNGDYIYVLKSAASEGENIIIYDTYNPLQSISSLSFASPNNDFILEGNMLQRAIDGNLYFLNGYDTQNLSILKNTNDLNNVQVIDDYKTFTNSIGQLPKLIPYANCSIDFAATETITSNQIFDKAVQNTITATNIVSTNATANYNAGTTVFLKSGFTAKSGATFKAYIEGCSVTTSKNSTTIGKTTIQNNENEVVNTNILVYPNPVENVLKISSNKTIASYTLLNSLNSVLLKEDINANEVHLNIQNLPSGIYILRLTLTSGEIVMKRIIKK